MNDVHEKDILRIKTKLEKKFNLILIFEKCHKKGNYFHYTFIAKTNKFYVIKYSELYYDKRYNHTTTYYRKEKRFVK